MNGIKNPYLDELLNAGKRRSWQTSGGGGWVSYYWECECHGRWSGNDLVRECNKAKWVDMRGSLVIKYAWAIPDSEAILRIAEYGPIVELGAGTGYWAWMLEQAETDIIAFDNYSDQAMKLPRKQYARVRHGNPNILKDGKHKDRALLLCWPPCYNRMASRALKFYEGETLIYVGESDGGCTGDPEFHLLLEEHWNCINSFSIPQWDCIHDSVFVFKRKDENGR